MWSKDEGVNSFRNKNIIKICFSNDSGMYLINDLMNNNIILAEGTICKKIPLSSAKEVSFAF